MSTDQRTEFLMQTARALVEASAMGLLSRGQPIQVYRAETINGPRAGAVRLYAGAGTGPLLRALTSDDRSMARQFIGWPFSGDPSVYLDGQALRLEAPWPRGLAVDTIRLRDIYGRPRGNGIWVLGQDETGGKVMGMLDDSTPHWLLGGTTGSGKTIGMLSTGLQLSRDESVRMILIDGNSGAGLRPLINLPGVIGPLATEIDEARAALGWAYNEMQARSRKLKQDGPAIVDEFPHLVIMFDEFQEFVKNDATIMELQRRLAAGGRKVRVHCLLATQHPVMDAFGKDSTIKRNLPGRVALKVMDGKASEVLVGAPIPRADRLTGAGDSYVIGSSIHRTQLCYVDQEDIDAAPRAEPQINEWPQFSAEDIGQECTVRYGYSGEELAYALRAAVMGDGAPRMADRMEADGLPRPGGDKRYRLHKLGAAILEACPRVGLDVRETEPEVEVNQGTQPGDIIDIEPYE